MDWREPGPRRSVFDLVTHRPRGEAAVCGDSNLNMNCPLYLFEPIMSPPESSLLHDNVAFVLCLDTLANADELYMHVSRPPKPDTPMHAFMQLLEEVTYLYCKRMLFKVSSVQMTWCSEVSGPSCRWFPPGSPGWSWVWSIRRSTWWSPQWPGSTSATVCAGSLDSPCPTWTTPNRSSGAQCWTPCRSWTLVLICLSF